MENLLLVVVIAVALGFDFVNGFHDAANSIATVVATRVLTPGLAVVWAAAFNFIAFLVFGTKVAATIATGVVDPSVLSIAVVFAGLGRGHRLERPHRLPGAAVVVLARTGRGHRRRGGGQGRLLGPDHERPARRSGCSSSTRR